MISNQRLFSSGHGPVRPAPIGKRAGPMAAVSVLVIMAWPCAARAQIVFTEVGASHGIQAYWMPIGPTGGIAAADFDADGDIDLFIPNGLGVADQLYRNLGDGRFEEIAASLGLASTANDRAALWFDFDGDHDLDLLVGGDCRADPVQPDPCADPVNLRLYRQEASGGFLDVTVAAGLDIVWGGDQNSHRTAMIAGDIDNDGYLDLYVTSWNDRPFLLHNNTDGTFSDITAASGIGESVARRQMSIMADFNGDGLLDIYTAVDFGNPNALWINQGDGTFADVAAAAGVDDAFTDMGTDLGDYDNDGDLDLYVTNITQTVAGVFEHNVLYRNDSTGSSPSFTEVSQALGVAEGFWGWGATFLDADLDGWLDLAETNGRDRRPTYIADPSRFFMNTGGNPVSFVESSTAVGFDDTFIASCLIAFDLDRDGDLDLAQTTSLGGPLRLLENRPAGTPAGNHFLVVKPRMRGTNHLAIGAIVKVTLPSLSMMRLITAGKSMIGQEPAEAHFGLGQDTLVDSVTVQWPGGGMTRLDGVPSDTVITVSDGCDGTTPTVHPGAPQLCDGLNNDCLTGGPAENVPPDEVDDDGDGYVECGPWAGDPALGITGGGDCDDTDASIYPGASETCNGIDDDCNSLADFPGETIDLDGDGSVACADCNDAAAGVFPGNTETTCNGIDDDCDASTPDDHNMDGDPFSVCSGDCDDLDPAIYPGNPEVCDGKDNDCDGVAGFPLETADADLDGILDCADSCMDADADGYGTGPACVGPDCNDSFSACTTDCSADSDGDGIPDCGDPCFDRDQDGYGSPADPACQGGNRQDCDDLDSSIHPDALETNDTIDNQCPGDYGFGIIDEIAGDAVFLDATTLSWTAQPGATLYEVVRSPAPDLQQSCTANTTAAPLWSDSSQPPPGVSYYYLIRALAPNTGSFGETAPLQERVQVCP